MVIFWLNLMIKTIYTKTTELQLHWRDNVGLKNDPYWLKVFNTQLQTDTLALQKHFCIIMA